MSEVSNWSCSESTSITHSQEDRSGWRKKKTSSKQLTFAQNQKQILRSLVREKRTEGWKYAEIAWFFQLDYRTVKRYCNPQFDVLEDYQQKDSISEINYYVARLQTLLLKYEKLFDVYKVLVGEGYSRTFSTFQKSYKPALEAYKKPANYHKKGVSKTNHKIIIHERILFSRLRWNYSLCAEIKAKYFGNQPIIASFRKIQSDCSLDALDQWIKIGQ